MENRIPTAHLADLFPGIAEGRLLQVSGHLFSFGIEEMPVLHPHEQLILAAITQVLEPRIIVEFGTAQGQTTVLLAANSPDDAQVITVDLESRCREAYSARCLRGDDDVGACFRTSPLATKITTKIRQLLRSHPEQTPPELQSLAGRVGFVLIDGDHGYRGVRTDSELALALAGPDALFAWHDFYRFPAYLAQGPERRGVYPYLNELATSGQLALYHLAGSYLVLGRRRWPGRGPAEVRQPGAPAGIFQERIVRLSDT